MNTDTFAAPDLNAEVAVAGSVPAVLANYPVFQSTGDIRAVIAANLEGESLSFTDLDRIKVPSGGGTTWTMPTADGEVETKTLEGIVAVVKMGRSFWDAEYDGQGVPPDCFSSEGSTGKGDPGGNCESCPKNQYESARKGLGKACKEVRSIFFVMPGTFLPTVINVPPTGLKDFKRYRLRLANAGINVNHVLTKFTLIKAKNKGGIEFSQIVFTKGEIIPAPQAARMDAYIESLRPVFERAHTEAVRDGSAAAEGENPFND